VKLTVEARPEYVLPRPGSPDTLGQLGGDVVITLGRRWVRFAAYAGSPPGSHIGLWRTRWGGLRGVNLRLGRRYVGPCLTLFIHTKRREVEQ
jgi:hypothetical protein